MMNGPVIQVVTRNVYGVARMYVQAPYDEPIRILTGTKTIDNKQLDALKQLGYTVNITVQI